jgi:flagellar hook-basal body complex protein FliE
MQIDPMVTAVTNPLSAAAPGAAAVLPGATAAGAPFAGVFAEAMGNLETLEQQATGAVEGLVAGRGVDIHAAMIATEKSDLAFEMALAVRGKMVSAYQAMMGVQF